MLLHYQTSPSVREAHGAAQVFAALRARGIRIALDTGFERRVADAILDRLGWSVGDTVDALVTSDEVPSGRPDPAMIFRAMERVGVRHAERVAKVGDTPADLKQGMAAGCALVVGVTSGSHSRDELEAWPHTHLIDELSALLPILDDLMPAREPRGFQRLFTPGPLTTSLTVKSAMLRDAGSRDPAFIEIVHQIREELLELAGVSRERGYEAVLMQGSGTFGVESVLGSVLPNDGRLVVLENGVYGQRMVAIAERLKIPCHVASFPEGASLDAGQIDRALALQPAATHVALVHCETTTGALNRLDRLVPAIRRAVPAAALVVDAMSTFGAVPLDVSGLGVDFLISSANKCIEGVPGFAFVVARREALVQSRGSARSYSLDLHAQWQGFERDGQFRFTPPTHALLAFAQALAELREEGGVAGRAARYNRNHVRLIAGMRELGFREYLHAADQSDIITAFHLPAHPAFVFDTFYARLADRGLLIYPGKVSKAPTFRIGTIGRLFEQDIDDLLQAIAEVIVDMGVALSLDNEHGVGRVAS
jgi:2-aminoethylphosphonate-pyruvate transaminase